MEWTPGQAVEVCAEHAEELQLQKVSHGPEWIELPPDVLKDLSTDQSLLYQLAKAVHSGHLPREVTLRKPGAVVHSR